MPQESNPALVLANNSDASASCVISTVLFTGSTYFPSSTVGIQARSSTVQFFGDLFRNRIRFPGEVAHISCDVNMAATALSLAGGVFAALPAVISPASVAEPNPSGAIIVTGGCSDGTYINDDDLSDGLVSDCLALVGFANSLIGTNLIEGDNVIRQWGSGAQILMNAWEGVTVFEGRVVAVDLSDSDLKGRISTDIALLTELQVFGFAVQRSERNDSTGIGQSGSITSLVPEWQRIKRSDSARIGQSGRIATVIPRWQ